MEKLSKRRLREAALAARNRRELIAARLSRRDLVRMGLVTSAGWLVAKRGLSARARAGLGGGGSDPIPSPPTRAFIEPLPIMPIMQSVASLTPAPTVNPNTLAGEGRTRSHQAFAQFPPGELYAVEQREQMVSMSPDLPQQTIWGFKDLGNPASGVSIPISPGPTYKGHYNNGVLVRNWNRLPLANGGFGIPEVSTHLHNHHTPSESDGNPCDFFPRDKFYDQHYPNLLAGCLSTHVTTGGDINESLSTLWYHDHRVDFTAQNVYKGLAGFYLLFNEFDTGDETTGFRLPSGTFDVPMLLADKVFDPDTGLLFFDLFNLDGIIGDKFLVNGKIQPFFQVHPRRYRFRWLDAGPSRFYQFFLTDPNNVSRSIPFWQIANDGNLLPKPLQVTSTRIGVAERVDVIVDFSQFTPGTSIYLENRLEQEDGRGPTNKVLGAGQGNSVLRFDVVLPSVTDNSRDPATITKFYDLPDKTETPRVTRVFRFERGNGQWQINQKLMTCIGDQSVRFRVKKNSVERWILQNNSGGWQHPIHIHFEEFQILKRNGSSPPLNEISRKDVVRLQFNEQVELFFRFRDFVGRYPLHCHNTVHEDHAMMLIWEIVESGWDDIARP
jgi:FtsP/CotA-like multicopper oxidase with cupredoxin domain